MIEIKPFRAFFYNQQKVKDLSKVVCPPYDVISPKQQDAYYKQSDYNFIRALLSKEKNPDNATDNKYTRAQEVFEKWIRDQILIQDEKPCIYFYMQKYRVMGVKYKRMGFISLMKLQDPKGSKVYPHERTHARAKEDRLKLWDMLSANLSSIFVCYSDKQKKVTKIFTDHVLPQKPLIDIIDSEGVEHTVWRLADPKLIKEISQSLQDQQLFIADGHHRYEVARELSRIKRGMKKKGGGSSYDYLMTYFTDMDSRELRIFPIHRVIKKLSAKLDFLEECFRIDKVKSKESLTVLLAKAGKNEYAFGLYTPAGLRLLRLKNKMLIDKHVTEGSKAFRHLDATILKNFILDKVSVVSEDIFYTKDVGEAIEMVDKKKAAASFIMNPVGIQQLREIALNGERMPPKTTYFYPKVLSGLTIYKME